MWHQKFVSIRNYSFIALRYAEVGKNAGLRPLSELPASTNTAENNKAEQKKVTPVKRVSIIEAMQRDKRKSIFKRI